ncbi:MAG: phospholipase D-like domain-containing protein [Kiritimatiellia bacterium]
MKTFRYFVIIGAAFLHIACGSVLSSESAEERGGAGVTEAKVKAVFDRDCEELLLGEIRRAEREIACAVYMFTRRNIADALAAAKERGVRVSVKYDAEAYEWKGMKITIGYLRNRGVRCTEVRLAGEYPKMHHKFMVIDGGRVLTGSYNYTTTASTGNHENLVLIESAEIAERFLREFESMGERNR